MKITDIEIHEICPPFHSWNSQALIRHQGSDFRYRTMFVVHTDNGLEGLGDGLGRRTPADDAWVERIVGTDAWDWLAHPELPTRLAPAIYDLVAKYNEIPVYRIFGQRVQARPVPGSGWMARRVPVSAWTVSQTPAKMAEEVIHAVKLGHTWLKYHTNHFHNVVEQTEAMQDVAPPGFKIHYDMNFDNTVEHIVNLSRRLEKYPIAGAIEDPLTNEDFEGYKQLRLRSRIPIYFHHLRLTGREAMLGLADGYLMGHTPIGQLIMRAGLFEGANMPFMMQNTGGNITRAFVAHMASVFPTATIHHVTGTDLWSEDVVSPSFTVEGGTIAVTDGPGLGVTLNRDALERWEKAKPDPNPRSLVRVKYRDMPLIFTRVGITNLEDRSASSPSFMDAYGGGYDQPVDMDYWDDDGSKEFADLWDRASAGPVS